MREGRITEDVMQRVLLQAFPEGTDPAMEAAIAKVLGHVWFSCLVAWSNGVGEYVLSDRPSFNPNTVFTDQNWTRMERRP